MNNTETEINCRIVELTSSDIELLKDHGFEQTAEFVQHDQIFDKPDASLFKSGQKIRIRDTEGKVELTYKGTMVGTDGELSETRTEINVPLNPNQVESFRSLLAGLGYPLLFQFKKRRRTFTNPDSNCQIDVDTYPIIGDLAEIEGPTDEIHDLAKELFPGKEFGSNRLKDFFTQKSNETGIELNELISEGNEELDYDLGKINLILE